MNGVRAALSLTAAVAVLSLSSSAGAQCTGDCDNSHTVSIDDFKIAVEVVLGSAEASCPGLARDDGEADVADLIAAAGYLTRNDCPEATISPSVPPDNATATPTPTPTDVLFTETPTQEPTPEATTTPTELAGPIIFTVAGTGTAGLNADGMPPLESQFYLPQDVTMGPDGLLYIVDWNNHRVRRIKDGVIETIAGTGELGDATGDVAIYVKFNHPTNVSFDHDGKMLIAAWHNSQVKRIDLATGLVSPVAGDGSRAYGGDEGPATAAKLDLPSSTAVDSNGNIYISDQANFRIRQVEPNGTIHTIAGTGVPGFGGDGGRADSAQFQAPKGQAAPPAARLCIDDHNRIYIADTGNNRIRMIDTDGTIDTIAGTGEAAYTGDDGPAKDATLNTPSDVAIGPDGSIYVADTMNNVVRVISPPPDRTIRTFAGTGERGYSGDGGLAAQATLDRPYGVDVAANGDVYVADTHNQRIRKIVQGNVFIPPTPMPTATPQIIPCSDEVGSICTYLGTGGTGYNGDGFDRVHTELYWPFDIEFMPSGRRLFLDWNNHQVREILEDDTIVTRVGTDFVGDGPIDLSDLTPEGADPRTVDLNHPTDLQEFPNGDIAIMCWHNHKIRVINHETGRVRVFMGRGAGGFPMPGDGIAAKTALVNQPPHGVFDPQGNFFFIDQRNQRIRVLLDFATQGDNAIIQTVVGIGPPPGFNGDNKLTHEVQLNFPTGGNPEPSGGLALDAQGDLFFSDTNNHRIRRVHFLDSSFANGVVTTLAGTGTPGFGGDNGPAPQAQINYPEDMEIGPDGNLYFADTNNHRVRMINLDVESADYGNITTVAGTGVKGYGGDGGPALEAQLNRPFGIAFDQNGDLYISDTFNSRIRKVKR